MKPWQISYLLDDRRRLLRRIHEELWRVSYSLRTGYYSAGERVAANERARGDRKNL